MLASASTEAFIQELAAHIDRCHKAHDWTPNAITPTLVAAAQAIATTQGLLPKYLAAAVALGQPFDAGSRVLKDAGRLMELQRCIIGCASEQRGQTLTDEVGGARGIAKARHPDPTAVVPSAPDTHDSRLGEPQRLAP